MVGNIVLVFISYSVLAGLIYADELTWIQSASSCTLANQQEIETANAAYPPSWIGGYFLTTTWVAYLGCFYNVTSFNDDSDRYPKNSPDACLSNCSAFNYFTLEFEHCRCLNSRNNLHTTDPADCKSEKRHKYFDVYRNINITEATPRRSNNQRLHCTNIKVNEKTNTSLFKAVLCDERHSVLCETSGKEISVIHDKYYTFAAAQKKCTILDYYPVKNSPSLQSILLEGKSYWTNVLRFSTKLWVDDTTDINALKDITKNMKNQLCLSASQSIGYPPAVRKLPCNNVLPFRCSPAYTPAVTADALNTGKDILIVWPIGVDIEQNCSLDEESMTLCIVVLGYIPFDFSYGPTLKKSNMAAIFKMVEKRYKYQDCPKAIPRKTTYDSLGTFPEATSESYNTTDSNGNGYEKFEDNDEIDRTRITEVFIIIIGITAFLSILIISSAIFVLYLYRQKRKQYSLEIQDQNAIKTRRDLYFATEDICNDYLGLQWIPSESDIKRLSMQTLNTDNSEYTTLNSAGKDISTNNVNTENATYLTVKSKEQVSTKQKVNSENASHTGLPTIRPVSSPKYATSTVTKSAKLGSSIGKANNKNAYTGVTLIRHIPSNKVDIDPGIETTSEYHHLDYTLKSDEKRFIDGNEPSRTKQKETDIVYEDPWEEETSKFQRAFSQIRQGMVHRGRSIRKSILKRQSRIRDNDAYTVTELSVDNVVYDSPKAEYAKEDVAENIIEEKDMQNKAEAMDGVGQCTLRNKVTRQSKCVKPDTRRSSVKLTFQRMFSLKTFKTPASFEQSNNSSSPDDNS